MRAEEVPPPSDATSVQQAAEKSFFETRSFDEIEKMIKSSTAVGAMDLGDNR